MPILIADAAGASAALVFIASNMRARDAEEIYGMRWDDDPEAVAYETRQAIEMGTGRVFHHESEPVAVCGAVEIHPGVFSAFAYGTDRWRHVVKAVAVYSLLDLKPWCAERGHRVECKSRWNHKTAHLWLESLGATMEGVLYKFGKDGADYYQFAWTRD